jgi:hypothetical protein
MPDAVRSLEAQRGIDLRVILIGHYPEREAHAELYRTLNEHSRAFDVLTFVGSDMRFVEPNLLAAIAATYARHPKVDRTVLGVDDWISGERILGIESWRRGTRWRAATNPLFPDVVRTSSRHKFKIADPGRPLVMHAEHPEDAQAIRYGVHRGSKAVAASSINRWRHLQAFATFVAGDPAPQRLLALAAVERAIAEPAFAARCLDRQRGASDTEVAELRTRSSADELAGHVIELAEEAVLRIRDDESSERPAGATGAAGRVRGIGDRLRARMDPGLSEQERERAVETFFTVLDGR